MATKKPPAKAKKGPKLVRTDVAIEAVDPTYAESVRVGTSADHVERLQAAYSGPESRKVPRVELYTWEGADCPLPYLLAEGNHRRLAKLAEGAKKIPADLWVCATEEEARRLALEKAAGSNEHPGLTRSHEDKRQAIKAVMLSPLHAKTKDRQIADICKVHHALVRRVREFLSHDGQISTESPAHSSKQGYKDGATLRGGMVSDGKGGLIPKEVGLATNEQPTPAVTPAGVITTEEKAAESLAPQPEPAQTTPPVSVPTGPKCVDGRGRRLPESMVGTFNAELPQGVKGVDVPYALCPLVDDQAHHIQQGKCLVCGGRGWITAEKYGGLTPELKSRCEANYPREQSTPATESDHPYHDLMSGVTSLTRKITQAANAPDGGKLLRYLTACGLMDRKDVTQDGRTKHGSFKLLRGLRRIIDLAGQGGREKTLAQIQQEYSSAESESA